MGADSTALQVIESSLYIYGYGITTGLLAATCIYMSLLAAYYLIRKHRYAAILFIYSAICNFLFILFDAYSICIYAPKFSCFFPEWLSAPGKFIMPIAMFFSFTMFIKAIPIKTVEAYLFWEKSSKFYPFLTALFIVCFLGLVIVDNDETALAVSLSLAIVICAVQYIIANKTLNLGLYKSVQKAVFLSFVILGCIGVFIFNTSSSVNELQLLWFMLRSAIGTLVIIFSFVVSRFIIQEGLDFESHAKISGEGFFKAIYRAAKHHHFFIEYQPKIHLDTKEISGAEALVRWKHPKHGIIPPNNFIPQAENTDLINQICKWVVVRVVRDIKDMEYINIRLPISINFSVKNLNTDMVDFLIETLNKYDVAAEMIVVEITETMFLDMNKEQKTALQTLNNANIKLSMDDFGAGHSSFTYFDEIGLDELKLDRKIASNVLTPSKGKVISTIITLCHSLGIKVVAEGIEDEEGVQEKLLEMNCDFAQGYGICRPKRLADFIDWVRFEHQEKLTKNDDYNNEI